MTAASLFPFALAGQPFHLARSPLQDRARRRHGRRTGTPSKPQLLPPAEPAFLALRRPHHDPGDRPDACVPGRPPCGGSGSTATRRPGGERGERGKEYRRRRAGRGNDTAERGPATTARAAAAGPLPEGGPHRGPWGRTDDGPDRAREAKPAGITLHHSPEQSHHACSAEATRNPAAPREPEEATPTRERPMPTHRCRTTKTPERQRVPTSDDAPDAANSRSPTKRSARERDQSTPDTDPLGPEEGKEGLRDSASRGNAAAGRGDEATAAQPEKRTARNTRGAGPRRGSGQSRGREREGRTRRKARVRHGKTGGTREPTVASPTPRPAAALRRGGRYRARGGVHGALSPATTTQPDHTAPQPRQDDRQALPRVIPPRSRSGEARAAVDERANATRAGGGQGASPRGDQSGETPRDHTLSTR